MTTWSEGRIARAIALSFFKRKYLTMVPNCNWTGYECDMLAVTERLQIIDVEIKISRSDLKADAKKDKWWISQLIGYGDPVETFFLGGKLKSSYRPGIYDKKVREHPPKVWKHYYVLPADIWKDDLLESLPSKSSGVILISEGLGGNVEYEVRRKATPAKDAYTLTPAQAVNIARLATLRMWEAYRTIEQLRAANDNRPTGEAVCS